MANNLLSDLLKEQEERSLYCQKVLTILKSRYQVVDIETATCSESATAGHVYSFLALVLQEKNSYKFHRKIKAILTEMKVIKSTYRRGIYWFRGLQALPEDQLIADKKLQQHYKDRALYRERQRAHAKKRHQAK